MYARHCSKQFKALSLLILIQPWGKSFNDSQFTDRVEQTVVSVELIRIGETPRVQQLPKAFINPCYKEPRMGGQCNWGLNKARGREEGPRDKGWSLRKTSPLPEPHCGKD
jgi:hypothetical protein